MLKELINKLRVVVKLTKTDPGTYVGRPVLMSNAVAEGAGVTADPGMHCTQMYSLKSFPVTPLTNVVIARPVKWGILGPENALVLFVDCPDMKFRFDELMAAGAQPTYPDYLPHITFFYYGVVPDKSVLGIPSAVPDFEILLGPEEVSTLGEDVFEKFNENHDQLGRFSVKSYGPSSGKNTITGRLVAEDGDWAIHLKPSELLSIPGQRNEHLHIDQEKVDRLAQSISESGVEHPIAIDVDELGRPSIYEGNHRIRGADIAGMPIPAEVRYYGSSENKSYAWKPGTVYAKPSELPELEGDDADWLDPAQLPDLEAEHKRLMSLGTEDSETDAAELKDQIRQIKAKHFRKFNHTHDEHGRFAETPGVKSPNDLVVWHGSPVKGFTEFDPAKINPNDPDAPYNGFWFTTSEEDAKGWAQYPWGRPNTSDGGEARAFRLEIKNPATKKEAYAVAREISTRNGDEGDEDSEFFMDGDGKTIQTQTREELLRRGYDAIIHEPYVIPDEATFVRDGRVPYGKNGYELVKDNEYGGVDLYQHGEHITGYSDFADAVDQTKHGTYVVLDPKVIKFLSHPVAKFNPYHDEKGRFAEADAVTIMGGEKVGHQSGSIAGGVYEGTDKIKRYVKFYDEPKQAINERVANEVYHHLGFAVPDTVVFRTKDGKGGFASELMDNKGVLGNKYTPDEAQEVSQGIAADILLGNRDVLGMGGTNILRLPDGSLGRIDHGGALFYRALGTPKTPEALNNLQEIEGFFNPQYDMGRLMHKGGLTELSDVPDIQDQIDQIESLNNIPGSWEKIVASANTKAGPAYDQKLADLLRLRAGKLVEWRDTHVGNDVGYDHDLSGPPLEKWADVPTATEGWQNVEGQDPDIKEPTFPKSWKHPSAGVIIQEPDGRVWIVKPTNHYGGYLHTFPKGTQEKDLTLQQTAIKEAYEETGLKVKLTGHFGDYGRDTSIGRYYTAVRVGGSPLDHGWETAKVRLVEPGQLDSYLNKSKDKEIAAHINDYPDETPSVPDEKPRPKLNTTSYGTQLSFDDKLREYYRNLRKFNHEHYPAGSPGGTGGQFMPTGSPGEILAHLSPGVSSGSVLYNSKVKALHEAANHPTNPVTAIANTPSYGSASHGYAKKFIALKTEAMAHAKATAEKVKPLPEEPPLWAASHQQAKWNNGTIKKLTAAAKGPDPMDAVAHVSIGATAKPFVKNYKEALMKHFAQQQGPADWKQFLQPSAKVVEFPMPPATQTWMTNTKSGIKNVLLAAKTGSSTAVLNANVNGSLKGVYDWQKQVASFVEKNPKAEIPNSLLQEHGALGNPLSAIKLPEAAVKPLKPVHSVMPKSPSTMGMSEEEVETVDLITAHGHAGNATKLNTTWTGGMHPGVSKYKLEMTNYLNAKETSPTKLTATATNLSNLANSTGSKADHLAAYEAHVMGKEAWKKEGHGAWAQWHDEKMHEHLTFLNGGVAPPKQVEESFESTTSQTLHVEPKHIDYKFSTFQKPVDQLKEELEAKKKPLILPEAPPVKAGIPEDQVKLYTDKIAKIKAAAYLSDPIASIDTIPGQSSSIQGYKNAVKAAIFQHQGQKVKEIGDTVASLKLVGTGEPLYEKAFPTRKHQDFASAALVFRQGLPQAEQHALSSYQGSGYATINHELRHHGNKLEVDGLSTATKIKNLDKMFEKTSLPMDTHVIRNIGNVEQLQLSAHSLVGHIVQDPAFMSSSLEGHFGQGLPVELHLNVPKGSKALYLTAGTGSSSASEYEVVVARRSLYRIDKVETKPGSYYGGGQIVVIHASMLPRHLQPKNT